MYSSGGSQTGEVPGSSDGFGQSGQEFKPPHCSNLLIIVQLLNGGRAVAACGLPVGAKANPADKPRFCALYMLQKLSVEETGTALQFLRDTNCN